jgi:hypothetical protein
VVLKTAAAGMVMAEVAMIQRMVMTMVPVVAGMVKPQTPVFQQQDYQGPSPPVLPATPGLLADPARRFAGPCVSFESQLFPQSVFWPISAKRLRPLLPRVIKILDRLMLVG